MPKQRLKASDCFHIQKSQQETGKVIIWVSDIVQNPAYILYAAQKFISYIPFSPINFFFSISRFTYCVILCSLTFLKWL